MMLILASDRVDMPEVARDDATQAAVDRGHMPVDATVTGILRDISVLRNAVLPGASR